MDNKYLILFLAYLIGSIPFGLVFSYIAGHGDIRKIGSGNIGTTNVLRTGSKKLALLTLIADSGKIILAMILSAKLGYSNLFYSGAFALIGHLFPIWLKFKGGKGVASFLGYSLYLFPEISAILMFFWIITFYLTGYSSLAAIVASCSGIVSIILLKPLDHNFSLVLLLITLILIKHKENFIRLYKGEESKFKKGNKK